MASDAASTDNLEFYMKFPNSNFNYNQELLIDSGYKINESNTPVVLLLGWAGCQDKYLAKYSAIYEDKGLITIRYTAPVNCLFWKRHEMKILGEKLVKLLFDMNFENHPIIIHLFSNGGAYLYQHISTALERTEAPVQIKGVIFDSAPGERRVTTMYYALSAIIGGSLFYNIPVSLAATMFICLVWIYEIVCMKFFKNNRSLPSNPFKNLKDEKFLWPQHFIFSKADDLIPFTDVEKFAEYRQQKGVDVTKLCFEDSPHVKHYIKYRDPYINSACAFIKKCLVMQTNNYTSHRK